MGDQDPPRSTCNGIYETFAERSPDGLFAMTEELEMVFVNQSFESLTGKDRNDIIGNHAEILHSLGVLNREAYDRAIEACRTVLAENSVSSRSFQIQLQTPNGPLETEYRVVSVPDDQYQTADLVGTIRDISERVEKERQLERQRNELNSVSKIQFLIHQIIQSLSDAPTRDAIKETVCERLVASEYYQGAWIADVLNGTDDLSNLYTAGLGADLDESVSSHLFQDQGLSFVTEALDTGQPQVITDVESSPLLSADIRQLSVKFDYSSLLALPIAMNDSVVAILIVGTERKHSFGSRELGAFEVLADLIAFALSAVEGKRLLLGEMAVEYELRFSGGLLSSTITSMYEGELLLETVLPITRQGCRGYFIANPALPSDLVESTRTSQHVTQFEVVETWDTGARYEVILTKSPIITLAEAGVKVVGGYAADGASHICIQTTKSRNPKELVKTLQGSYPDVEIIAERNPESTDTRSSLPQWLDKELTTKQRQMLEGAYYQGYFNWPRERSAEAIAASFDITSSTFHAHIRKALKKVLAGIFENNHSADQFSANK